MAKGLVTGKKGQSKSSNKMVGSSKKKKSSKTNMNVYAFDGPKLVESGSRVDQLSDVTSTAIKAFGKVYDGSNAKALVYGTVWKVDEPHLYISVVGKGKDKNQKMITALFPQTEAFGNLEKKANMIDTVADEASLPYAINVPRQIYLG
jgi:hypothetical protein